ncbi:hypothetical protein M2451_003733 [Dysgonomonas sp. PFB1-18]|uniref:DUF6731 family protein n=1 Tax=unclassified Dysgonomonas TaxID=2630389 RepID=UPI00247401D6|nr:MULTISPECIES: DUF6731 family protein [unclassified Dysgonomonas]MDH6310461.1 hypothetical protein [Dysgonomonas sp. PF1-14]MDH6340771.1 hypothetical protein [Dysgonomonas sp. PF1-16]MDH6382392.1 hypothetical protein [Dysgonomonas sp. PFB1-18]MDH6399708.1 hypothetical protein [Dysgonomonas sp. PF1-23]
MKNKKVLCSLVDVSEDYDFDKLLLDGIFKTTIYYKNRDIEMSHITTKGDFIMGMFVSTQKKDLAPIHTPGDEDDYSAVPLKKGQGLAYPNVFLYDKKKKILLWEVNRLGVLESSMQYFFEEVMHQKGYPDFFISLNPLMFPNAYKRIKNLVQIQEIEFQIASPTAFLRKESKNGTLSNIAKVANDFSASKAISITVKANELQTVNKRSVLSILGFIDEAPLQPGRIKNRVIVKGLKDEGGTLFEETINYIVDRMSEYFPLTELTVASNLQIKERKDGIENVYKKLSNDLDVLLG